MKKKRILVMLLSLVLALGLAACGGKETATESTATSGENQSESAQESSSEEAVEIWTFYDTFYFDATVRYADRFTEETGIPTKVTQIPFGDFKSKLTVASTAGQLPDIVFIDNCDTVAFSSIGIFHDLTEDFGDDPEIQDYFKPILDCCYYDDKLYAVPLVTNNIGFYYNKDMFEAAGITEPPKTWDELYEDAKKCTTDDVYGLGLCMVGNEEGTFNYLQWQLMAGGNYYDLNSDAGIEALTYLKKLADDGVMPRDVVGWSQNDLPEQFSSGRIAIMQLGCWFVNQYDAGGDTGLPFNYGTFEITGKTNGSVYGGENMAVCESDNLENGLKFAHWMMKAENVVEFDYDGGQFAAREATVADPRYQTENWAPFTNYIQYTTARPADPAWPSLSLGYQYAIQAVISGGESPEEAAENGQAMIDEARAKYQ